MATGRIHRTARRGVAVAVLGWLSVAAASVVLAPSAGAAPAATIEIRNVTPPVASVDPGGTVTFVNKIPAENRGGISIPLPLGGSTSVGATVFTDVTVDFFGQPRNLQPEQSTAWRFDAPATAGTITYTYRVVPQAQLPLGVSAQQVVDRVLGSLPELPAPIPYVVQTIAPALPNLPSVGVPQLPQVIAPLPPLPLPPAPPAGPGPAPEGPPPTDPGIAPPPLPSSGGQVEGPGDQYTYSTGAAPSLTPRSGSAAAAFDPSRLLTPASSTPGPARSDSPGTGSGSPGTGSGGLAGGYDGATVPVFGQLAGLDGTGLDEEGNAVDTTADPASAAAPLPAAALVAIVALAAASAALVRTHQASRATK